MFKKRTRPTSVREKPTEPEQSAEAGPSGSAPGSGDDEESRTVQELIALRKYRKPAQGIDLVRLNQGESKVKKKKKAGNEPEGVYGLQPGVKPDDDDDLEDEAAAALAKRIVRSNNFTQQTNALDTDKHMVSYIEQELAKRRGGAAAADLLKPKQEEEYDPQAELYKIDLKYDIEKAKKLREEEEGNHQTSMGTLTSIPEIDLGMDNRLKNIEETEKAKRAMMEQRKTAAPKKLPDASDFAAARFFQPKQTSQSDRDALEDARRESMGLPPITRHAREKPEVATDEAVYERFKKRLRKN